MPATDPRPHRLLHTTPGVYAITHVRTGRRYIGSSTNPADRWGVHRRALDRGEHPCAELQHDWVTDSRDAFRFEYLAPATDLRREEQRLIVLHRRADVPLYNQRSAARRNVTTEAEFLAALDSLGVG